ncbi:MAG: hypothetical protein GDA36_10550 [Rhodobacteraceae bacterium]|nr:hypothetical protein [Paracoccaceae bacterium]
MGAGVDYFMDSVGKDAFDGSLDCLKPLGMIVSFGNVSGLVSPVDIGILATKGSLKLTCSTLICAYRGSCTMPGHGTRFVWQGDIGRDRDLD